MLISNVGHKIPLSYFLTQSKLFAKPYWPPLQKSRSITGRGNQLRPWRIRPAYGRARFIIRFKWRLCQAFFILSAMIGFCKSTGAESWLITISVLPPSAGRRALKNFVNDDHIHHSLHCLPWQKFWNWEPRVHRYFCCAKNVLRRPSSCIRCGKWRYQIYGIRFLSTVRKNFLLLVYSHLYLLQT